MVSHRMLPQDRLKAWVRAVFTYLLTGLSLPGASPVRPLPPIGPASRGAVASWYGLAHEGRRTAGGGVFRRAEMTAAHRTAPFGTRYLVFYRERVVEVVVNDRGPYIKRKGRYTRDLDLSEAAARDLGLAETGVARITLRPISYPVAQELHLEQLLPSFPSQRNLLD